MKPSKDLCLQKHVRVFAGVFFVLDVHLHPVEFLHFINTVSLLVCCPYSQVRM